jgi:hypothetical protein
MKTRSQTRAETTQLDKPKLALDTSEWSKFITRFMQAATKEDRLQIAVEMFKYLIVCDPIDVKDYLKPLVTAVYKKASEFEKGVINYYIS